MANDKLFRLAQLFNPGQQGGSGNVDQFARANRERARIDAMRRRASSTAPVGHWTQGLARVAEAFGANIREARLNAAERARHQADEESTRKLLTGWQSQQAPAPMQAQQGAPAAPQPTEANDRQQAFMQQMWPHALEVSKRTGVDPRLVIGQAALESGYGAKAPGNNFFGIKSHGRPGGQTFTTTEFIGGKPVKMNDSFRSYADMGESAADYANFLQQNARYRPLLQAKGLDAQIEALGRSGYATDPNYASKVAAIARGIPFDPQSALAPSTPQSAQASLSPQPGGNQPVPDQIPLAAQAPSGNPLMQHMASAGPEQMMQQARTNPAAFADAPAPPMPQPRPPLVAAIDEGARPTQGVSATQASVTSGPMNAPLHGGSFSPDDPLGREREMAQRGPLPGPAAATGDASQQSPLGRLAAFFLTPPSPAVRKVADAYGERGGSPAGAEQPGGQQQLPPEIQEAARILNDPNIGSGPKQLAIGMINDWRASLKPKDATWGVTGQDQFGKPIHGWIDPRTRSVTPHSSAERGPGFDDISKLRSEIRALPSYKSMAEVAPRYNSMLTAAGRDNRASDLTLVYGLMKILDPTSVVRESEADMAQNIATLPSQYRAQVQSFLTGQGRLAPAVRQSILEEAHGAAQAYRDRFDLDVKQYGGIVERNKMNPADVIPTFTPFQKYQRPQFGPTPEEIDAEIKRRGLK